MRAPDLGLARTAPKRRAAQPMAVRSLALAIGLAWLLLGCGRTGLRVDDEVSTYDAAAATPPVDAGHSMPDAAVPTWLADAGPPAVTLPLGCDREDPTVRLLADDGTIFEFDPLSLEIVEVGVADCGEELNSMSIDQQGVAYVSSQHGKLFRVDVRAGTCVETDFDPDSLWGEKFTMGFVADRDVAETLYIIEEKPLNSAGRLSTIDTTSFELTTVGTFPPDTPSIELSGTGDGRIFGFVTPSETEPARLVEIDPQALLVTHIAELPVSTKVFAFDFAFWGGAFYLFASESADGGSKVTRFALPAGPPEVLGEIAPRIIGAGSSVCAPLGR